MNERWRGRGEVNRDIITSSVYRVDIIHTGYQLSATEAASYLDTDAASIQIEYQSEHIPAVHLVPRAIPSLPTWPSKPYQGMSLARFMCLAWRDSHQ